LSTSAENTDITESRSCMSSAQTCKNENVSCTHSGYCKTAQYREHGNCCNWHLLSTMPGTVALE